jgi:hypothetical protein
VLQVVLTLSFSSLSGKYAKEVVYVYI